MTIEPEAPIQVRKVANGFIITPAASDEFVSDEVTLVFVDEVGVTKWLVEHFAPVNPADVAATEEKWRRQFDGGQAMGGG
jgi:hypothetical protein